MSNKINVKSEFELYEPMRIWLHRYLEDKYKGFEVITIDAHSERLDRTLMKLDIVNDLATGVDIQIDILGVARKKNIVKLFFIEVKKTNLTLRDLGQLWSYCKLINPEEAFLMTSAVCLSSALTMPVLHWLKSFALHARYSSKEACSFGPI